MCAHKELLTETARKSWGFDGYVTSDCGAVGGVQHNHKYTNTSSATVAARQALLVPPVLSNLPSCTLSSMPRGVRSV